MRRILVFGATSAIAEAAARRLAERGDALYLVARDEGRLGAIADDLAIRGAAVVAAEALDANDLGAHAPMLDRAERALAGLDAVLIAHGTLPDQARCQASVDLTLEALQTNALSTIALLTRVAARFEARRAGTIVVLSSVAGDRGRASNYVYGAAKAALTTFLSGLRQRLHKAGVRVVTIKPGFIDTPMTAALPKGVLWATPAGVAPALVAALDSGRPVVYLPWFWRWIMRVVVHLPERLFVRLAF